MPDEEIQGPPLAPDDAVPVNQNPGESIVPAGTPVLRADALDDPQDDPDDQPDGAESPPEAPEAPAEGDGIPEFATGGIVFASGDFIPVCPVCGLNLCGHNLPYTVPKG